MPFRVLSADPDGAIELNIDETRRSPNSSAQTSHTISPWLDRCAASCSRGWRATRKQQVSNPKAIPYARKKVGFGNLLETWSKPSPSHGSRLGCTDACIRVTRKPVPVFVSQRHGAVVDGCKRPAHNAVSEYAFVRSGHVHIIALHPCKMQFAAADTC